MANFIRRLWAPARRPISPADVLDRIDEDVCAMITRCRFAGDKLEFGPNFVHAYIKRGASGLFGPPGLCEDLGWSKNLKTTVGMDWLHNAMGGGLFGGVQGSPATVVTATAVTATGTPWGASALVGYQIFMPITGLTTAPVYGNIGANTTSVATIDQWWTGADGAGGTPASTNAFTIRAGTGPARFMALTTDVAAPAVGDTTLASENTTNGVARALAAFAHTPGGTTYTLVKTWTATGALTALHKAGLFTSGTLASAGILVANSVLNADATLATNDQVTVTYTWTLPAAG